LYRLRLENADAGDTLHAVAEEGVRVRDIAEAIGRGLRVRVLSLTPEESRFCHEPAVTGFNSITFKSV
jgi:hypothetical protein